MFAAGTPIGDFVTSLSASSEIETLDAFAQWSETDEAVRLDLHKQIAELKARDPKKRALELAATNTRWRGILDRIAKLAGELSNQSAEGIRTAREDLSTKAKAARVASETAFGDLPLGGVGRKEWRALWEAARAYSEHYAYPTKNFPVTDGGARCPLCQQELSELATSRFVAFEVFVKAETERLARDAYEAYGKNIDVLQSLVVDVEGDTSSLQELAAHDGGLALRVDAFLAACRARKRELIDEHSHFNSGDERFKPVSLTQFSEDPRAALEGVIGQLEARRVELDGIDISVELKRLQDALLTLEQRKEIFLRKDDIATEIGLLKRIAAYEKALKDTNSKSISDKSAELTRLAVSKELVQRFGTELRALSVESVPAELRAIGARRGSLYHKVGISSSRADVAVQDVVSEGEHRAIALAAFLSEVGASGDGSAVVLDDPVSSLDHLRREAVAHRLAQEGAVRQVIVFTHDIVFLLALSEAAQSLNIGFRAATVQRCGGQPGHCSEGLPWECKSAAAKVKAIKHEWVGVDKIYRTGTQEEYQRAARELYGELRDAWEKAVEEVYFCNAVGRFRRSVETKILRKFDWDAGDYDRIENGMSRCSTYFRGHNQSARLGIAVPGSEELKADIDDLESWIRELEIRRNARTVAARAGLVLDSSTRN